MKALPWMGWFVAVVLAVVLLWPEEPPVPPIDTGPLVDEIDSLKSVINEREARDIQIMSDNDSIKDRHDSIAAALPEIKDIYARWRSRLRDSYTDSLWHFMGELPDDTAAHRHFDALGRGEGHDGGDPAR